jgi:hypothetical protein
MPELPVVDASTVSSIQMADPILWTALQQDPYQYEITTTESPDRLRGRTLGVSIRDGLVELFGVSLWIS